MRSQGSIGPKHVMMLQYDIHRLLHGQTQYLDDCLDEIFDRVGKLQKKISEKFVHPVNYLVSWELKRQAGEAAAKIV